VKYKIIAFLRPYWWLRAIVKDKYFSWKFGKKKWEEAKTLRAYGERCVINENPRPKPLKIQSEIVEAQRPPLPSDPIYYHFWYDSKNKIMYRATSEGYVKH
jgi:hypothetical protein